MPATTSILSPTEALRRLQTAVADAAAAVEHERQRHALMQQPGPSYDQGHLDSTQRVLNLIAIRMVQLPRNGAAQTELRRLREAILERP